MVEFRGDQTGALHRFHSTATLPVVKRRSDNGADGLDPAAGKSPRRSAVCVRLPEEKDWPDLRQLVRRQHQRTIFADIPFSEAKLEALVQKARHPMPNQCLIVAEARGQIVGAAWCSAGEYLIGEGALMTTVHLLAVDTERCGSDLSAKVFLCAARRRQAVVGQHQGNACSCACHDRHRHQGNRPTVAGSRGEVHRRRLCVCVRLPRQWYS